MHPSPVFHQRQKGHRGPDEIISLCVQEIKVAVLGVSDRQGPINRCITPCTVRVIPKNHCCVVERVVHNQRFACVCVRVRLQACEISADAGLRCQARLAPILGSPPRSVPGAATKAELTAPRMHCRMQTRTNSKASAGLMHLDSVRMASSPQNTTWLHVECRSCRKVQSQSQPHKGVLHAGMLACSTIM